MTDTAPIAKFKCFPISPNHTNKKPLNSKPRWFFSRRNPSNGKDNIASPHDDQVSMQVRTGQAVPKEEYDRVLRERSCFREEIHRRDVEIDQLREQLRRITDERDGLISYLNTFINCLSHAQLKIGSSSNSKEPQSGITDESRKAVQENKTRPVRRVAVDIIGARASGRPSHLKQKREETFSRPEPQSAYSYTCLFDVIRTEKQNIKAKDPGIEGARANVITLARLHNDLCYTDIFHDLEAKGLVTPQSPETAESGFYIYTSYHRICEFHKGGRGHSTENCPQLRWEVGKLMRDVIKPPNQLVLQDMHYA